MSTAIKLMTNPAVHLHVTAAGHGQVYLVASIPTPADAAQAAEYSYNRIAHELNQRELHIVHERIFGSLAVEEHVMAAREEALMSGEIPWDGPVNYVQGHPPWGEGLAGVIIHAVSCEKPGEDIWTIMDGDLPCGRGWKQNGSTYLVLQDIQGYGDVPDVINTRPFQAWRMIERADSILRKQGASYRDTVRTWFYLSRILDWYREFNDARNAKYDEFGILPDSGNDQLFLPASTGVLGNNPQGTAGTMDLLAIIGPEDSRPFIKNLHNKKQEDAFRYGSAFSRGTLIQDRDVSLIQVSGTAAIDENGASLYPGDIRGQIHCTFDKIETLIAQEGAGLEDICSAMVFVKSPEDAEVFREMAEARGIKGLPAVCVVADVCREELLFEMDAEVVVDQRKKQD